LSRQAEEPRSTNPVEPKLPLLRGGGEDKPQDADKATAKPLLGPLAEQQPAGQAGKATTNIANAAPRVGSSGQQTQSRGGNGRARLTEPPRAQRPPSGPRGVQQPAPPRAQESGPCWPDGSPIILRRRWFSEWRLKDMMEEDLRGGPFLICREPAYVAELARRYAQRAAESRPASEPVPPSSSGQQQGSAACAIGELVDIFGTSLRMLIPTEREDTAIPAEGPTEGAGGSDVSVVASSALPSTPRRERLEQGGLEQTGGPSLGARQPAPIADPHAAQSPRTSPENGVQTQTLPRALHTETSRGVEHPASPRTIESAEGGRREDGSVKATGGDDLVSEACLQYPKK
jgi:hypothetical protein